MKPIVMTEKYWANSQLSFVRNTGGVKAFGANYTIVNKEGKDIFKSVAVMADYISKNRTK